MAHKPLFKPKARFSVDDLIKVLGRLDEFEEDDYDEAEILHVLHLTPLAARIVTKTAQGREFTDFFPLSQMRELEGTVYLSKWIREKKGIA